MGFAVLPPLQHGPWHYRSYLFCEFTENCWYVGFISLSYFEDMRINFLLIICLSELCIQQSSHFMLFFLEMEYAKSIAHLPHGIGRFISLFASQIKMLCSLLLRYAISEYFFSHKLLRLFNLGFQLLLSEQIFQFIIYSKACSF